MNDDLEKKQIELDRASEKVIISTQKAAEDVEIARQTQAEFAVKKNKEEMREVLLDFFGRDQASPKKAILLERVDYICDWIKDNTEKTRLIHNEIQGMKQFMVRIEPILKAYDGEKAGKDYISQKSIIVVKVAGFLGAIMAIAAFIKWIIQ